MMKMICILLIRVEMQNTTISWKTITDKKQERGREKMREEQSREKMHG